MEKIKYNGLIYNIMDIINIEGTYHLIIKRENNIHYINKVDDKYYEPPMDLSLKANKGKTLEFVRKQHILKSLIEYIEANEMYDNVKVVTEAFKEYVKTSFVETFMYWPFMSDKDFDSVLIKLKRDLSSFLDKKLHNRVLAPDNQTIIIIDDYVAESKFGSTEDFIPDPSYKKRK